MTNLKEHYAREARALAGALALARIAGWTIDRDMGAPTLTNVLLAPSVMTDGADLAAIGRVMGQVRADAVVVKPGPGDAHPTLICAVGIRAPGGIRWRRSTMLWLDTLAQAYLVPDPDDRDADAVGFRLSPMPLQPCSPAPWSTPIERDAGFAAGEHMLSRFEGGR